MRQSRLTFKTTKIRRALDSKPTQALHHESQYDDDSCKIDASYSDACTSYSSSTHDVRGARKEYSMARRPQYDMTGNNDGSVDGDPVLAFITMQREKIGKSTHTERIPQEDILRSTSTHVAGIMDLKHFSRKTLQLKETLGGKKLADANKFLYALSRECVDGKWNAYDLCIVEAEVAMAQSRYFTISAFNVCEVRYCFIST